MRTLLAVLVVGLLGTSWADDPPPAKTKPPYERLLKGDDEKTAAALEKRIADLEAVDRYVEAVKVAEELAALRARVQGPDHWQTRDTRKQVHTLQKIGTLPATERAKLREANTVCRQAESDHAKGKYAEAQPLFEKALAIIRQALGEKHPETANVSSNLALNLNAQGKYADAQPLYEKALAIWLKDLGEEHPDTALGFNNVASNLNDQGKYADAQLMLEKALAILRQVLGEEHPYTAKGYNNLATNLKDQGRYADAQPLYEKALAIKRQALGEEDRDTANGYSGLANNLKAQGKYADAQPLYEKALAIWLKTLGAEHSDTAHGYNNLASNLKAQGKYADAQPRYDRALAIWRKTLGEEHPDSAQGYNNVASNLDDQERYADAQPMYDQALAIWRKTLGEDHPDTADGYNNLALNLNAQGRYADAQPRYEKALAIWRKALGEEHPRMTYGYNNLAGNLNAQGKYADALATFDRAIRSYEYSRQADVGATEPALDALRTANRLREYRFLHFATHGEANDVQALESRLILTQDAAAKAALPRAGQPTLDGKLTAREVLDFWHLDAELVTLSACETALGREGGGDGLLGFAQAFLTAGSRAVCLSLWKVDDTATALLMDRFYQNLTGKRLGLSGRLGKADALAEAKQWLRTLSLAEATQRLGTITAGVARGKDQPALKVVTPPADPKADPKESRPFAHPTYWAAFVLIGDPD